MKPIGRDATRVEESPTRLELTKAPPVTGVDDECGSLGQVDGAQGVLIRPERIRGREQTLVSPLCYVGEKKLTCRGSYDVHGAARLNQTTRKANARKAANRVTEKAPE